MPESLWDSGKIDAATRGTLSLVGSNIKDLFQRIPDADDPDSNTIGNKLRTYMEGGLENVRHLHNALESEEARQALADWAKDDPASLNQSLDTLLRDDEITPQDIVRLRAQAAAPAAPAVTASTTAGDPEVTETNPPTASETSAFGPLASGYVTQEEVEAEVEARPPGPYADGYVFPEDTTYDPESAETQAQPVAATATATAAAVAVATGNEDNATTGGAAAQDTDHAGHDRTGGEYSIDSFLDEFAGYDGFDQLLERFADTEGADDLADIDSQKLENLAKALRTRLEQDDNYFVKLNQFIENSPSQAMDGALSSLLDNPDMTLGGVDMMMGADQGLAMMSALGATLAGESGFLGEIGGWLQQLGDMLGGLFGGLMERVGPMMGRFNDSMNEFRNSVNDGSMTVVGDGELARQAAAGVGADPNATMDTLDGQQIVVGTAPETSTPSTTDPAQEQQQRPSTPATPVVG